MSNKITDPGGDFEITPARSGEVLPKPEPSTLLDEAIRALDEGDGAAIFAVHDEIKRWLLELRRYRETIACARCKQAVAGRHPVCLDCFEVSVRELIAESLAPFKASAKKERALSALRSNLKRKIGR